MHTIESLKQTATLHIKRLSNLELTSDQTKRLATFASYLKWKRVLALAKKGITCVESIKAKYCALCSFYYNSYGDAEDLCQGCPSSSAGSGGVTLKVRALCSGGNRRPRTTRLRWTPTCVRKGCRKSGISKVLTTTKCLGRLPPTCISILRTVTAHRLESSS